MILVELTLVEIMLSPILLPDLPLLVSRLVFVMVARSKECTTISSDRQISKLIG